MSQRRLSDITPSMIAPSFQNMFAMSSPSDGADETWGAMEETHRGVMHERRLEPPFIAHRLLMGLLPGGSEKRTLIPALSPLDQVTNHGHYQRAGELMAGDGLKAQHAVSVLRVAHTRATKVSSLVPTPGRKHGSLRIKLGRTSSVKATAPEQAADTLTPDIPPVSPLTDTAVAGVAPDAPAPQRRVRRKPVPRVNTDPATTESSATQTTPASSPWSAAERACTVPGKGTSASLPAAPFTEASNAGQVPHTKPRASATPPRLPAKSEHRTQTVPGLAPYPYLEEGLIPVIPPPRPAKSTLRAARSAKGEHDLSGTPTWPAVAPVMGGENLWDSLYERQELEMPALTSDHESASASSDDELP